MKKNTQTKKYPLSKATIFVTGSLCLCTCYYLHLNYGVIDPEQMIFHLKVPISGMESGQWLNFIYYIFVQGIALYYLLSFLYKKFFHTKKYQNIFLNTWTVASYACMGLLIYHLGIVPYVYDQFHDSTFVEEHYTMNVDLKEPTKKRNLIHIYIESMETSFANKENHGLYDKSLIQNLQALALDPSNINFSNTDGLGGALQLPVSSWTTAGMVGQTSGAYLNLPPFYKKLNEEDAFLPHVQTIGSILAKSGYNQEVMFGSDSQFGAKDLYFKQHGNYKIFDLNYAINHGYLPSDYHTWWGFEDEKLFAFAKDEITELSKQDKPFNFTMLTNGTHAQDGYPKEIYDGYSSYESAVLYSDEQINEFVEWIKQQPFYEDTLVIISGDHLTMNVDLVEKASDSYDRAVYNVYINSNLETDHAKNRSFTTMDLCPTTLHALGYELESPHMGLGTDLFSNSPTLMEQYGYQYLYKEITKNSSFYKKKILDYNAF